MTSIIGLVPRLEALAREQQNLPQFTGTIYYVDAAQADDTGDGLSPSTAKKTIGAAIALLTTGDAITIKAGTYTETGLTLGVNACELWFEIGSVLDPATGTCLTISGNYCKVQCPGGSLFVTPGANETGVLVSGNGCYVHDVRVNCASVADLGFDVTGSGGVLTNCRCADPLIAAFKVQGDKTKLDGCCTGGQAANTSIGFWITNNADQFRIDESASQGHASGSFVVDTGCTNGCIRDCSSGVGDGRWQDGDHVVAFSGFQYDDDENKILTFAGVATTYNLFQVTGSVRVYDLYGIVRTQLSNVASTLYLQLYSTGGTADITDAPGTNVQAANVGATLIRNEDATNPITLVSAATPGLTESADWRSPKVPVTLVADADQATYIRIVLSAALAAGVIRWHCRWEPLSDDGFLEAV